MARKLDFSPVMIIKEKDGTINTALVVDNGPPLLKVVDGERQYTDFFNEMIEEFPNILTASFYNKRYTSYRIKLEGEDIKSVAEIKRYISGDEKEEKTDG